MDLIIDVIDATQLLTNNKQKHVAEYELQTEAWKKAYSEYTVSLNEWSQVQSSYGEPTRRPKEPVKPHYYVKDYDKLLAKLSVHVGETIALREASFSSEYEQIFENKFSWSNEFATLSAGYVTSGHISEESLLVTR